MKPVGKVIDGWVIETEGGAPIARWTRNRAVTIALNDNGEGLNLTDSSSAGDYFISFAMIAELRRLVDE